ncbi:hypothetical protein BJX96DRAFT_104362 [Aspergillus floccosus]
MGFGFCLLALITALSRIRKDGVLARGWAHVARNGALWLVQSERSQATSQPPDVRTPAACNLRHQTLRPHSSLLLTSFPSAPSLPTSDVPLLLLTVSQSFVWNFSVILARVFSTPAGTSIACLA